MNNNDPIDPSTLNDYVCPLCPESFLALFLYIRHSREQHGSRLAPLSPSVKTERERAAWLSPQPSARRF